MLTTIIFVALLGVLVTGLGTWLVARRAAPRPPTTSTGRRPNGNGPPGSTPPARSTDGPVAGHHTPGPTTDAPGKYDK